MRRSVKIILLISGFVVIVAGYAGYRIYNSIMGSEPLSGSQGAVPEALAELPPVNSGDDDWTQWRGKEFNDKSLIENIVTDWTKGLEMVWEVDYLCQDKSTASWSSMAVKGNRLVVPGRDEHNDLLFCLESSTGKLLWKASYPSEAGTSHGPGPRATPSIDGDQVFTFGRSGDLACWDLYGGALVWKVNMKSVAGAEPQWGYASSPLVYKNEVIVQAGGEALAVAFDKKSGSLLWKSMKGDAGYAAPVICSLGPDTFLLIFHASGLSCLSPDDGKEYWTIAWPTDYGVNATTPLVDSNKIFITSSYNMGGEMLEFNKSGAKVIWKNMNISSQHSDPILLGKYIYGYSGESSGRDGKFKCIAWENGKEMWTTSDLSWGTTVYGDGYLICLDVHGNLYLVKPDPLHYKLVSTFRNALSSVTNPAWTCPVIANGRLYLRYLQHLVCYKLQK